MEGGGSFCTGAAAAFVHNFFSVQRLPGVSLHKLLSPSGTPPPLSDITNGSRAPLIYMHWAPAWSSVNSA